MKVLERAQVYDLLRAAVSMLGAWHVQGNPGGSRLRRLGQDSRYIPAAELSVDGSVAAPV